MVIGAEEFEFTPKYIKGENHVADFMSRPPEMEIRKVDKGKVSINESSNLIKEYHQIS